MSITLASTRASVAGLCHLLVKCSRQLVAVARDGNAYVVTRYAVSRAEREFEPILQQYRDNARESTTRDSERAKLSMTLSNAKEKSTLKQQTFDIINHTSKTFLPLHFCLVGTASPI